MYKHVQIVGKTQCVPTISENGTTTRYLLGKEIN